VRREIAEYMGLLYKRGLTSSLSGNVSARAADVVYISPTKIPSFRVVRSDVSVVTMQGLHIAGRTPSTELPAHLEIYRATECKAVIHVHSHYATALSCLGHDLEPPDVEGKHLLGRIPLIPYAPPGTHELGIAISRGIAAFSGVLLENHGQIAVGADLEEAFIRAEAIEKAARLVFDLKLFNHR